MAREKMPDHGRLMSSTTKWCKGCCGVVADPDTEFCGNDCEIDWKTGEIDRLEGFIKELADEDCVYGDNCPPFGSRHGVCLSCGARKTLGPK